MGIMRAALVLAVLAALLNVCAVRGADDPSVTLPGVVDLSAYRSEPAYACMLARCSVPVHAAIYNKCLKVVRLLIPYACAASAGQL